MPVEKSKDRWVGVGMGREVKTTCNRKFKMASIGRAQMLLKLSPGLHLVSAERRRSRWRSSSESLLHLDGLLRSQQGILIHRILLIRDDQMVTINRVVNNSDTFLDYCQCIHLM